MAVLSLLFILIIDLGLLIVGRGEVAEDRVAALRDVEALEVLEDREPGLVAGLEGMAIDELGLERCEKFSASALSEASRRRPLLGRMPASRIVLPKARLGYCPNSTGRRNRGPWDQPIDPGGGGVGACAAAPPAG
jgi:hypothetical protein